MNPDQREINVVPPGTLIREESYGDLKDHPDYAAYLQLDCDHIKTGEIMTHWTDQPIMSEGFSKCHFLVATKPDSSQAQGIHVSYDSWSQTNPRELRNKTIEWKTEDDHVLMVYSDHSSINYNDRDHGDVGNTLGNKLHSIPLHSKSRFGLVYDVKKRILLVQLTDDKVLRVYQGV